MLERYFFEGAFSIGYKFWKNVDIVGWPELIQLSLEQQQSFQIPTCQTWLNKQRLKQRFHLFPKPESISPLPNPSEKRQEKHVEL